MFIFFGAKENERRVVCATPLQKGTRVIRRVNNTAGPPDSLEFMPGTGTPQKCRDFKNSRSLCSNECSDSLKSLPGIFSGAQQMPMGKYYNHAP